MMLHAEYCVFQCLSAAMSQHDPRKCEDEHSTALVSCKLANDIPDPLQLLQLPRQGHSCRTFTSQAERPAMMAEQPQLPQAAFQGIHTAAAPHDFRPGKVSEPTQHGLGCHKQPFGIPAAHKQRSGSMWSMAYLCWRDRPCRVTAAAPQDLSAGSRLCAMSLLSW